MLAACSPGGSVLHGQHRSSQEVGRSRWASENLRGVCRRPHAHANGRCAPGSAVAATTLHTGNDERGKQITIPRARYPPLRLGRRSVRAIAVGLRRRVQTHGLGRIGHPQTGVSYPFERTDPGR